MLPCDDTVYCNVGDRIHGEGRHRDPVRSTRTYTAWRYGHEWIASCVLLRLPFAERPWALPILIDLDTDPATDLRRSRPHLTPVRRMIRLLKVVRHRLPEGEPAFVCGGSGSQEIARYCSACGARP